MARHHVVSARRPWKKPERLEARLPSEQKRLIERAAQLRGTSVTDFVLASAQQAAMETIEKFQMLSLRDEASRLFVSALLSPPTPNAAARTAVQRYKSLTGK
jgi:uncharacterized protein (DUF1778 family)